MSHRMKLHLRSHRTRWLSPLRAPLGVLQGMLLGLELVGSARWMQRMSTAHVAFDNRGVRLHIIVQRCCPFAGTGLLGWVGGGAARTRAGQAGHGALPAESRW